jgi:hypothetical protein
VGRAQIRGCYVGVAGDLAMQVAESRRALDFPRPAPSVRLNAAVV